MIFKWTMPNESRICGIYRRVLILKKGECCWPVCRSKVYVRSVLMGTKTEQGRLRGRQVLGNFLFFSRLRFEISRLRLRFFPAEMA